MATPGHSPLLSTTWGPKAQKPQNCPQQCGMLQSHSILNGLSRHVWQGFRPAYSIQGPGVLVTMAILPAKIQEHTCLRKSPGCLVFSLDFVFSPFMSNDALGQVWKQTDHHPTLWYSLSKTASPLFSFCDLGASEEWTAAQLQFAEGSHRAPAVREPSHAREGPGGRGYVAPEILCHSMWSWEGFVNDSSWADCLLLCGWWNGH